MFSNEGDLYINIQKKPWWRDWIHQNFPSVVNKMYKMFYFKSYLRKENGKIDIAVCSYHKKKLLNWLICLQMMF